MITVFPNGPGDRGSIPSHTEASKNGTCKALRTIR